MALEKDVLLYNVVFIWLHAGVASPPGLQCIASSLSRTERA